MDEGGSGPFPRPHGAELEEIRREYDAGRLDRIRADLEVFLRRHRGDIARYRADEERKGLRLDDVTAVKFFILRHRSINPRREIEEQLDEIRREKWIRGVHLGRPPDEQEVAQEWASRHSAAWRAHRLTAIVYVFEREKDRFLAVVRDGG